MKYLISIIIILSFFSCKTEKKDNFFKIDLRRDNTIKKSVNYFKILDTITLEETDQSHIQKIHKISIDGDNIFILDKALKYVFQFDSKGNFLNRYSDFGDAPHQATNINDFSIDIKNKIVYILSVDDRKILRFDYNGNFKDSKRLNFEAYDIDFLKIEKMLVRGAFYDEEGFNLRLYDYENNKVINKYSKFPKDVFPVDFGFITGSTSYQNNNYLYNNPLNNIIKTFDINTKDFYTKYQVDFGENQWPKDKLYDFKSFLKELGNNNYSFISPYLFENRNMLFLKYNIANPDKLVDFRYLYFDKSSEKKYIFNFEHKRDEVYAKTLLLQDDIFYSSIKAKPLQSKNIDSVRLESNPKLVKYRFIKD